MIQNLIHLDMNLKLDSYFEEEMNEKLHSLNNPKSIFLLEDKLQINK